MNSEIEKTLVSYAWETITKRLDDCGVLDEEAIAKAVDILDSYINE